MIVVILFAILGGMAYASIPAILKVKTGAHEVVTTIMLNGVAASLVACIIRGPLRYTDIGGGFNVNLRTDPFPDNAAIPDLGHLFGIRTSVRLSWVLPMALVAAAIVWFIFKRMRLGYEARAVGASPGSALAGGISIGKVQIRLFLLSGALAGLIGIQQLFADQGFLPSGYEAGIGFTRHRRGLPRAEQPGRDRVRRGPVGRPGPRGDLAPAPDRRAARVRDHPAGDPDPVGRGHLPGRDDDGCSRGSCAGPRRSRTSGTPPPSADVEGLAKEDR